MKYLSDYTKAAQTELFSTLGAFFAFSNAQLEESRVEGVEYCSLGSGLIVPVTNARQLVDGLENITKEGIEKDLAENGKAGVIRRELFNHECFYDGDVSRCINALEDYGIPKNEVVRVYNHIRTTEDVE